MENSRFTLELQKPRAAFPRQLAPLVGLAVVTLIFTILTQGRLFAPTVLRNMFDQCYLYIIAAFGASFLFAQGALDLSIGSVIALAAIAGAYSSQFSPAAALLACLGVGLAIGLINGFIYSNLKIMVFIQGLAMSFLIKGMLFVITKRQNYIKIPAEMKTAFGADWIKIAVLAAFALIVIYLFRYTICGKHAKAIGAGEEAAVQSGVNVKLMKRFAFIMSGLTASIVAFLILCKTGNGGPSSGSGYEFSILVALVLGGMPMEGGAKANLPSCVIGPLTVVVLETGMSLAGFSSRIQEIVTGLVFILVMVSNTELAGMMEKLKRRRAR